MSDLVKEGNLKIRPMRDDPEDYELMAKWLTDMRVLEFYEGRDNPMPPQRIKENFAPGILGRDGAVPCILEFENAPMGYMQFYPITEDADLPGDWKMNGLYGMDQFIGEPGFWNRGIGTRAVSLLVRYLFDMQGANGVIVDPHATNARAIRCYEKCGFKKVKLLPEHELHEGEYRDCWLMVIFKSCQVL